MTDRLCTTCHTRPVPDDRYTCPTCVQTFRDHITQLPSLLDDLTIAATRQARFTDDGPRLTGTTSQPLPYDPHASDHLNFLKGLLIGTAAATAHHRGEPIPGTYTDLADYLDIRAHWLASHQQGAEQIATLIDATRRALRIVDRPPDKTYVGPCTATTIDPDNATRGTECGTELYTTPGRDHVTCPRCAATYPVQDRRTWLLNASWEAIATGPEIARALAGHAYGRIHINLSTLRNWAAEGRLTPVDRHAPGGRPRYRVGDVVQLATDQVVDNAATCTDTQIKKVAK